jgi:hypothetical protein
VENHICLSHGVQVTATACRAIMRIVAGVEDLMQRIGDGRTCQVLGDRTIERLGDTVWGLHRTCEDDEHEFLG